MENHPIPQDITGFQFKLIGEMTLKQFAYVAIGVILAWVLFILPIFIFIKIPLVIICGLIGVALAFVPIDGRPMDLMIAKFFKAIFSPTQYIYQKQSDNLWTNKMPNNASTDKLSEDQLKSFLDKLPKNKNKLDKKESVFFQSLDIASSPIPTSSSPAEVPSHYFAMQGATNQTQNISNVTIDESDIDKKSGEGDILKTAQNLEEELTKAKTIEAQTNQVDKDAFLESHQKVLDLQNKLSDTLSQKKELEDRLINLQKNLEQDKNPGVTPSVAIEEKTTNQTVQARSIPQSMTKSVGLPAVSEFPNVLSGIVKDPRGNPLANILVEVKDGDGNAVRAFKTSLLGQFASATPLNNGSYTVEFEDPNSLNKFEKVAFQASGEVILPIEIISLDQREELRRSLFN